MRAEHVDWRDRAACLGENTELFFPVGDGVTSRRQIDEAKRICRTCPVIARCAEVAIRHGYEGIWGGLDDRERRLLRRTPAAPTATPISHPDPRTDSVRPPHPSLTR